MAAAMSIIVTRQYKYIPLKLVCDVHWRNRIIKNVKLIRYDEKEPELQVPPDTKVTVSTRKRILQELLAFSN